MRHDDYLAQLQALLPPGLAWKGKPDSLLVRLLSVFAAMFSQVHARSNQLVEEADPRTCSEMLVDWERVTGLPDPFYQVQETTQQTVAERRDEVVYKLTSIGGQSIAYFIALAKRLGYDITITEYKAFRAGESCAGDPLTNFESPFHWQVHSPQLTIRRFRAGSSAAGEPLAVSGNETLERVLRKHKPAHTEIIFSYYEEEYDA